MKYDNIINKSRPETRHACMDMSERAKIFSPFAALRGHDDAIEEERKRGNNIGELESVEFTESI